MITTPEAKAIKEWNRLVSEHSGHYTNSAVSAPDALRFSGVVLIAHALVLGLTCIAGAIRDHATETRGRS